MGALPDALTEATQQLVRSQLLGFRGTLTAGSDEPWTLRATTGENRAAILAIVFLIGLAAGLLLAKR